MKKNALSALSWPEVVALKALERKAHKWAEDYCNYPISERTQARRENIVLRDLNRIFSGNIPKGTFYNQDPRGYALKIDPERGDVSGLVTDWGGYGLLAHPDNFK